MKKTTSTLIIVLILIIVAPLVGYFGTKMILLSFRDDTTPSEEIETPQTQAPSSEEPGDEQGEAPADEAGAYTVNLPSQTLTAVQLASLSSASGAQDFADDAAEKGLGATVMVKDGLYKVIHTAATAGDLSEALAHAKTFYGDAFMTTKALSASQQELTADSSGDAAVMQARVDGFFAIFPDVSAYGEALLAGRAYDRVKVLDRLAELDEAPGVDGAFATDFETLFAAAWQVVATEYSDYATFNDQYLDILQMIMEIY